MNAPVITLTTDFGRDSVYVAQLKGVILSRGGDIRWVDVTHDIEPQDIWAGAVVVERVMSSFPVGTVHVAVVDPGVGTGRRGIAVSCAGLHFVGPDNGVLGAVIAQPQAQVVKIENRALFQPQVSNTFHGRDIFVPVACELAQGLALSQVGPPCDDPVSSPVPAAKDGKGVVVEFDKFGNIITNIPIPADASAEVEVLGERLPWVHTYAKASSGRLVALRGSGGTLEIAMNGASAAQEAGLQRGESITAKIDRVGG